MGCIPVRNNIKIDRNFIKQSSNDSTKLQSKLKFQSTKAEKGVSPFNFYENQVLIGEGKYGPIYIVDSKQTNVKRTMSVVRKKDTVYKKYGELVYDFNFLQTIDHPNIVKIYELYDFENDYYFIYELLDCLNLSQRLDEIKVFTENEVSYLMSQILSALCFYHSNNLVHKDLNLENIFIKDKTIKILDLSLSQKFNENEYNELQGSPLFMSPESIEGTYTDKSNSWTCGIISYILITGEIPFFKGNDEDEMLNDLIEGNFNKNEKWDKLIPEAKEFIEKLIISDPEKRMTINDAIATKFIELHKLKSKTFLDENKLRMIASKLTKNMDKNKILIKVATSYIVHHLMTTKDTELFRKIFIELNTSNDGRLTKDQVYNGFKNIMNESELKSFVVKAFENIDDDNNGYIEFEEFVAGCLDKSKFFTDENILLAFKFLSNNSEKIKFIDLKKLLIKDKEHLTDDQLKECNALIDKAIKEIDDNYDGEIDFLEFNKVMKEEAGIKI